MMEILRKNKIPAIYTSIPWIRKQTGAALFVDCQEDIQLINQIKNICARKQCLSSFESIHNIIIKAEFPDELNKMNGTSGELVEWCYYHWNVWDVMYFIEGKKPCEAVPIADVGISFWYLESLQKEISCISLLNDLKKNIDYGKLTSSMQGEIEKAESKLFSQLRIRKVKGSAPIYIDQNHPIVSSSAKRQISSTLRTKILRRDNFKCVFCGKTSSDDVQIDVDHIIPRNLIDRLGLDNGLHTAEYNLCSACHICNIGKRDTLTLADIDLYFKAFKSPDHPNHQILSFLEPIKLLQGK